MSRKMSRKAPKHVMADPREKPQKAGAKAIADFISKRAVTSNKKRRHVTPAEKYQPELTDAEEAMLGSPMDQALGRWSAARTEAWLTSMQAERKPEDRWTVRLVKLRLQEAMRACERTTRRDGPSQRTGFWPAYERSFADQVGMLQTGQLAALFRRQNRGHVGVNDRDVARMEEAIAWPARYLRGPRFERERIALQTWLRSEAFHDTWEDLLEERGLPRSTGYRARSMAFLIICCGLAADAIVP